jgi:hypothetical protein
MPLEPEPEALEPVPLLPREPELEALPVEPEWVPDIPEFPEPMPAVLPEG